MYIHIHIYITIDHLAHPQLSLSTRCSRILSGLGPREYGGYDWTPREGRQYGIICLNLLTCQALLTVTTTIDASLLPAFLAVLASTIQTDDNSAVWLVATKPVIKSSVTSAARFTTDIASHPPTTAPVLARHLCSFSCSCKNKYFSLVINLNFPRIEALASS